MRKGSIEPAVAVQKLLRGSKWSFMQFLAALHQAKLPAKLAMKRFRVVAHHVKPAAFRRAFWSKRADNHVAAWLHSPRNLPNVGETPLWCCKKVEYRTVMPEIVSMGFQLDLGDIANKPAHLLRSHTQSLFRDFDCGLRNIQYREVLVSAKEKV